jgi:hypothetical protein
MKFLVKGRKIFQVWSRGSRGYRLYAAAESTWASRSEEIFGVLSLLKLIVKGPVSKPLAQRECVYKIKRDWNIKKQEKKKVLQSMPAIGIRSCIHHSSILCFLYELKTHETQHSFDKFSLKGHQPCSLLWWSIVMLDVTVNCNCKDKMLIGQKSNNYLKSILQTKASL